MSDDYQPAELDSARRYDPPDPGDWIVIPNWGKFQHYKDRMPFWIKTYTALLSDPNYIDLSAAARGLLHGLWMAYAWTNGRIRVHQCASLLRLRVSDVTLISLNHAGFIEFSSRPPLALVSIEKEKEKETPISPVDNSRRRGGGAAVNQDLLHQALHVAADWKGGSSETFSDALDDLERHHHAHLPVSVRERLWDEALKRESHE